MGKEKAPETGSLSLENFDINFLADPHERAGEMAFNWKIKDVQGGIVFLEREVAEGIKREATISKKLLFQYNPLLKEDSDFLQALQALEEKH